MNPELWRTQPWLAALSLAPILLGAAWFLVGWRAAAPRRGVLGWVTWCATRPGFAFLVWGLLGHAGIDQLTFFLPQARHAMAGALPYRDFASAYAPLFAPLLGLALRLAGDVGPFVLFLLADGVAWLALRAAFGPDSRAAWTWAAWPPIWYLTVRYAQDEPLAAACVALALLAARREHWLTCGAVLGAGLVITKPLFVLPAAAFLFGAPRAWRRIMPGFAAPVLAVYGAFLALGAPVWQPLALEGASFGIGPTVWRVPTVRFGLDLGPAGWLPFLVVAAVLAVRLLRRRADTPAHGLAQYGAFAALAPKFMPMYVVMWGPLIAAESAERRLGLWLTVYGTLLCLSPVLESGPLQGQFGRVPEALAIVLLPVTALLALYPIATQRAE